MIRFSFKSVLVLLVTLPVWMTSCNDDPQPVSLPGEDGFFVVNEGGFGKGNTSISFFDRTTGEMTNNVYSIKNGVPLGDQSQSMTVADGKGYIVVQGSGKVEVINADDFSRIHSIDEDIESPRYFLALSATKGYVTDWGSDGVSASVKVIDLNTYEVTKTIPTGKGANRMLKVNNLVYVTNNGGFQKDNTIKIIDTNTDSIIEVITVGDNPNSLQRDKDGNIWVVSSGALAFDLNFNIDEANSTPGSISKISAANTESLRLNVPELTYSTLANLVINQEGDQMYYTYNNKLWTMSTSATALPTTPFKDSSYYGLAVDPFDGTIVGCKAPTFTSAGSIEIFDEAGVLQNTYTVGIAPNGCAFK
jgi:YVTN family beta-propeller protein